MFTKKFNENQLPLFNQKYLTPAKCSFEGCNKSIDSSNSKKDPDSGKFMCNEHFGPCHSCEEEFINLTPDSDGNKHCKSCIDEFFQRCPNCNSLVENDDILSPTSNNKNYMKNGGCNKCAKECCYCGKVVNNDDVRKQFGGDYCEDCFSDVFSFCEECNSIEYSGNMHYIEDEGIGLCDGCFSKEFTYCQHDDCHNTTTIDDDRVINGKQYCEKCFKYINFLRNSEDEEEILEGLKRDGELIKFINTPSVKEIAAAIEGISSEYGRKRLVENNKFCNLVKNREIIQYINPYTSRPLKMGRRGPILEENPMLSPNPYTGKRPLIPLEKCRTKKVTLPDFWEPKPLDEQPKGAELIWQAFNKKPWLKNPKIIKVLPGEEDHYLNHYELKDNEIFDETGYVKQEDEEGNITYLPDPQGLSWRDKANEKNSTASKTYKLARKLFLKYANVILLD